MRRALLVVTSFVGVCLFAVAAPVEAQVATTTGTWVGEIVVHRGHLDYVGSPCPVEAEVCAEFIARYRLVPRTRQALVALRSAVGGTATFTATLVPVSFGEHHGILLVSAVT